MQQIVATYIPEGREEDAVEFERHLAWWSKVHNQHVHIFRTLPKFQEIVDSGAKYPMPDRHPHLFKALAMEYFLENLRDVVLWVDPHWRLGDVWQVIGWAADEAKQRLILWEDENVDLTRFCLDLRQVENMQWMIAAKASIMRGDPLDLQSFSNERWADTVQSYKADFDGPGKSFLNPLKL